MKYPVNTSIGNAGEFFFAYQIASVLGWPCRLFDIDIGIDAQVEILDADRTSTGRFVAIQIKTTSLANSKTSVYVSKDQVDYWKAQELPVFVALVDLKTSSTLLHRITNKAYPVTNGGDVRIDFDPNHGFDATSGATFAAASSEAALDAIEKYLAPVRQGAKQIQADLIRFEQSPDPERTIDLMICRYALKADLDRAETLSHNLKIGADECFKVQEQLDDALKELGRRMQAWKMDRDYDDQRFGDGEIRKFMDELR
ncbi:hypothetical protein ASD55_13785 [Rhodanobacter sp. Root561]|uniref:DUF4365 domain-containing protein n=1 Tax=Rhodanobacter sp. Root561 TaxID=1736560 RepID=UPI0006FB4535|nr:DUF4365 domain-containing protein [Rhodanobacter sp. Root561]KQZ69102.1 hypothetical protein ASD55_13785 [Rhodanobacter sp. Root561]